MAHQLLLVGLGGLVGSVARYLCVVLVSRIFPAVVFPWGTLAVNVIGCMVIGFLAGLDTHKVTLTESGRLLLFTGILGGFTTFSAFGLETFYLFRTSQLVLGIFNIFLQLVLGLGAVALGYWLSKLI